MSARFGPPVFAGKSLWGASDAGGAVFSVSAALLASTLTYGPATASFTVPGSFSVSAPLLASTVTYGAAVASFTAGPSLEPVTLAEVRAAARLDEEVTELDLYIEGAITAAREQAEHITGRIYRRREIVSELTDWPETGYEFKVYQPSDCAIEYWGGTSWVALDASAFEFAALGRNTQIAPALDTTWPTLGRRAVGPRVRVTLTAGPTSPDDVAEQVKLYIKAQCCAWIDQPGALINNRLMPSPLLKQLLSQQRLYR